MKVLKVTLTVFGVIVLYIICIVPILLVMYILRLWVAPIRLIRGTTHLGKEPFWSDTLLRSAFSVRNFELKTARVRLLLGASLLGVVVGCLVLFGAGMKPSDAWAVIVGISGFVIAATVYGSWLYLIGLNNEKGSLAKKLNLRMEQPVLF